MEIQHNGFLIIPAFIADDPDIDDSTAILFGRLVALSNQKGYCWASNEYLATLTRVKDRELQNRLKVLEDKGYLKREISKNGFKWDRKLYPIMNTKNVYDAHTCAPSKRTPVHIEAHTCAPELDKCSNNISVRQQQQPAAAAAVFSCIRNEKKIPRKEWKYLMTFREQEIEQALEYTQYQETRGNIHTTFIKTLKWALKEKPEITEVVNIPENQSLAKQAECNCFSEHYVIDALSKKVEISSKIGSKCVVLEYGERNFREKLVNLLDDHGFAFKLPLI